MSQPSKYEIKNSKPSWLDFNHAYESWEHMPKREKNRIQAYTRRDVEKLAVETAPPGSKKYWQLRIDAALILHHHNNPIVRHEAAFALSAFTYKDELERASAVKHLRHAMRFDPSPTARHEAIEALGQPNTFCVSSVGAAADICKINYLLPEYRDVAITAEETFTNIITWLKTKSKYKGVIRELEKWKRLPKLQFPPNVLTGSQDEAWNIYTQQKIRNKGAII